MEYVCTYWNILICLRKKVKDFCFMEYKKNPHFFNVWIIQCLQLIKRFICFASRYITNDYIVFTVDVFWHFDTWTKDYILLYGIWIHHHQTIYIVYLFSKINDRVGNGKQLVYLKILNQYNRKEQMRGIHLCHNISTYTAIKMQIRSKWTSHVWCSSLQSQSEAFN